MVRADFDTMAANAAEKKDPKDFFIPKKATSFLGTTSG
jgi:hypothetical protein